MSLLHRLVKPLVTITIIAVASWLKKRSRLSQKKRLIEDEIIVVVGASSGVGLEVARLYASNSGESPSRELHLVARSDMQALRDEIMAATNFESINTHRLDACNEHDLASLAKKLASGPTPGGNPRVDTLIIW